jgi:hypothetical protein
MRPIHVLLGLVVVLASGASAYVGTRLAVTTEPVRAETIAVPTAAPTDNGASVKAQNAQDRIAMLTARVDDLTSEIENLRNSANRAPAVANVQPIESSQAAGGVVVTELQRQAVLAVLKEDRDRQAAEAEAAREKADKEAATRRAARVAKDLNLSPGDEARLADLMVESGKKRQEMFDSMRNGNFDRETARAGMEEMRKWQTDQLTQAFGASIADQILQTEGERIFGGGPGGPGGFGGGGGGNGQGGAGQVRGARRQNAPGGGATPPGGGGQTQQN